MIGGKVVGAGGGGFLLVYARSPTTRAKPWRAASVPELRFDFEFQGATASSTRDHAELSGARFASASSAAAWSGTSAPRRSARMSSSAASTSMRGRGFAGRPVRRMASHRSTQLLALQPDVVIVAVTHDTLAEHARRGAGGRRRTSSSRSPPGIGRRRRRPDQAAAEAPGRRVKVGFNHRFHPGIARAIAEATSGAVRRHPAHACALRPRRAASATSSEWRADPRVSGRRRAGRPGHAPARPLALAARRRFRCTRALLRTSYWEMAVEDNAVMVLGEPHRGPWTMLHVSWTEWKNLFSLEIYCRTGEAPGRRPRPVVRPAAADASI